MEQSDGFNVAGKKGALLKGEEHSEFDAFDDAPKAGAYSPRRSILKAVVCVALVAVVAAVIVATAGTGAVALGVATGLFVGGSAAVTCLTVSDLANGRNSSWGTYAAKTLAGAVTGAVMRNFGGALGSLWPASGTLARAGLAGGDVRDDVSEKRPILRRDVRP
jgi:hypothetical protein